MNFVNRVKIEKFWEDKTVDIKFGRAENFLIGVNGSGKTTIINLIVSVLGGKFRILDKAQFYKITLYLTSTISENKKKSRIVVTKEENDITPFPNILYEIFEGKNKTLNVYLDDIAEERIFRDTGRKYLFKFKDKKTHSKDLHGHLRKLVKVNWLSIHRANFNSMFKEDRKESLVDIKLRDFSKNFTLYLNELNRDAKLKTDEFQKYIFLSLINTETKSQIYKTLDHIDIEEEKKQLSEIYELFNLNQIDYKNKLNEYANYYLNAYKKSHDESLSFNDAEYLIGVKRIHSVIQKWQEVLNEQKKIFEYKENFISLINNLLQRKRLIVNDRYELEVQTQSGKEFDLKYLSSGEKQLLIIFGETLLQKSIPHIFIADEPELSLHIEWQEKLVSSLKLLNPRCTINICYTFTRHC